MKISITGSQRQQLSYSMQKSLKILQMPLEELYLWAEEQVAQNPLLDLLDSPAIPTYFPESTEPAYAPSCFEYLMDQARLLFQEDSSLVLAEWIIGNLEPSGFYCLPAEEIPPGFSKEELDACLSKIQLFDPPGIAARSLQESLLIQLKILGKQHSAAYYLVEHHLDLVIDKDLSSLKKKLHITDLQLQKILEKDLSPLDPFPGYRFKKPDLQPIPTDIVVVEEESSIQIYTTGPTLVLKKISPPHSPEEKETLKFYEKQGHNALRALEQRNATLQKITQHIFSHQKAYLDGSSNTLDPLTIQTIAQELGLHESTVHRALANKNLSCSLGILPLKSLLSKNITEEISCDRMQKLLLKLIAEEDKERPLSDQALLEKIRKLGVPCARRTITKYRNKMQIPTHHQRKSS